MPRRGSDDGVETVFLSSDDIAAVAQKVGVGRLMDELIGRIGEAFRAFDPEECQIPVRTGFRYDHPCTGLVEWMPLMRRGEGVLMKLVGYHPENPSRFKLPTILSTMALFDVRNGHMKVLADGTFLTALRTGAASAVASELLAKRDSATVGLIGAGAQAMSQLHGISRVFPVRKVLVYDVDENVSNGFSQRFAALNEAGISIEVAPLGDVVSGADILCVATSVEQGKGPVFDAGIRTVPWLHINAVGSDLPGKIEVPDGFLRRSFVCPDYRIQAVAEGECQQLDPSEIGDEVCAVAQAPETYGIYRNRLTVFDSTGFALEDHVVLDLVLEYATELGLGTHVAFENIPRDPHNPYEFLGRGQKGVTAQNQGCQSSSTAAV